MSYDPHCPMCVCAGSVCCPKHSPIAEKREARIRDLEASLQAATERAESAHRDAMIAHRWFAEHFGEIMNGRDFAVKCPMATAALAEARKDTARLDWLEDRDEFWFEDHLRDMTRMPIRQFVDRERNHGKRFSTTQTLPSTNL